MTKMTDEHKAAMLAGRKASKIESATTSNVGMTVSQEQVLKRVSTYLPSAKNVFIKAFSGQSKSAGIKAKCIECSNLQKLEVANCLVKGCPLYRYRPYQKSMTKGEGDL